MKEGYNENKNPFIPGDLYHVHVGTDIVPKVTDQSENDKSAMYYGSLKINLTDAGKALTNGLISENMTFVFNDETYQILTPFGYFDFDEGNPHKHYRLGSEAINFIVNKVG